MNIKNTFVLLALSLGLSSTALAQRVIRIVVPFGPGFGRSGSSPSRAES